MWSGTTPVFYARSVIRPDCIPCEDAEGVGMSKLRTVKKYSNRRLYDLQVKRYVTLEEIYEWVVGDSDIRVIDKDKQEDITCSVLLQVVAAHENRRHPSMSVDFLLQAIRSGADSSLGMTAVFLDLSLKLFLSGQLQHLVRAAAKEDPTRTAERLAAENYQRWCSARADIVRTLANATSSDSSTESPAARPTDCSHTVRAVDR
jgi:polyhydroxyalkanoate synthesis repressor PhaR